MFTEDNREIIYGIVKNCYKEPVEDAVVKLVEIVCDYGKKERKPVTHTFTDKNGEFVFGPLCPGKEYALEIFVNDVKHVKICAKCHHEGKCLKAKDDKFDYDKSYENEYEKDYEKKCEKDYDKQCEKKCENEYDKKNEKDYDKNCEKECEKCCKKTCCNR